MLDSSLQYVKGVGPRYGTIFNKLGLQTIRDLLYFFPRAYDDRRSLPLIHSLKVGKTYGLVATVYRVSSADSKKNKSIISATLRDQSGSLQAVWFNQKYVKDILKPGLRIYVRGKIDYSYYNRSAQITVSEFEILDSNQPVHIVAPIYSLTHGLSQRLVRTLSKSVIGQYLKYVNDSLPPYILKKYSLSSIQTTIRTLHFPTDFDQYTRSRYRIVFEEFFWFQLILLMRRLKVRHHFSAFPLKGNGHLIDTFKHGLPYSLTQAQLRVIEDIRRDVSHVKPMNRLIQGDVGCGKTDVAVCAILFAIESGKNAVIMAPTEILAEQHFAKFTRYLSCLNIPVMLLKGRLKRSEKKKIADRLANDSGYVLVGTHAVIQDSVELTDIGIVIIDEQHRFGVEQRMSLVRKGAYSHCLYLTATPIPRSFMLTVFGDLDKSIIDELPPGRLPPVTRSVKEADIHRVYDHCIEQIRLGRQVFFVYPLVEDSEKLDLKSAQSEIERLSKGVFRDIPLGLLHGRMTDIEKLDVMARFRNREFMVLISTTVIEVGIDVPNATTIVIHHSDRFGLAQLHQLRGRVGRGGLQSWCFLTSSSDSDSVKKRHDIMSSTHDGFKIAEHDLAIRGPGDLIGKRQSGIPEFKLGDIIHDQNVMVLARNVAKDVLVEDPSLSFEKHSMLRHHISHHSTLFKDLELN